MYNYPEILKHSDNAIAKYESDAGFWFKEREFRNICETCDPRNSELMAGDTKINKMIFFWKIEKEEKNVLL